MSTEIRLAAPDIVIDRRPDGSFIVRSARPLGSYPERMTDALDHWARHASYRTFLAQRDERGRWRNLTYAETQYFSRRAAQALINRGLSVERPVVILSGNDIEHALLGLAAMYTGIPYAPISPEYLRSPAGLESLGAIFDLIRPGLVFVSEGGKTATAIQAMMPEDAELVVNIDSVPGATSFGELVNTEPEASLEAVCAHVHASTIFKLLFPPAPTEDPRGVIHTHRMCASNQEMLRQCIPILADSTPVVVDGLPWSDTFGGNAIFGMVLYNGGTLYIDADISAAHFDESLRNFRAIAPTVFWGMQGTLERLIPELRSDAEHRKRFFSRLRSFVCLQDQPSLALRDEWTEISAAECDVPVPLMTGFGVAEAGPFILFDEPARGQSGGKLLPGLELKLVPSGANLESRFRGPNMTFGYWRRLDLTRASFDDEGFYRLGTRCHFVNNTDASQGFVLER